MGRCSFRAPLFVECRISSGVPSNDVIYGAQSRFCPDEIKTLTMKIAAFAPDPSVQSKTAG